MFWLILPVQLFLRNQVRQSSKQGIQATLSTPIHHVKWTISRFRGIYRALAASEAGFLLILLKGLQQLYNVPRSSVLVAEGVLYLPLHFIIIAIIIIVVVAVVIIIVLLIWLLLLMSFLLFQLLLEFLSGAVYCSYEVSWPFGFASFNFFIYLNLIHATTIWCWRTTSILSFAII